MTKTSYYAVLAAIPSDQIVIEHVGTGDPEALIAEVVAKIGGDVTADNFVAEECTEALYELVEEHGTPDCWTEYKGKLDQIFELQLREWFDADGMRFHVVDIYGDDSLMFEIEHVGGRKEKLRVWGIADDMPVGKVIELAAQQLNANANARAERKGAREYY